MDRKFGIDISHWQGDFDLRRAVAEDGVQFVVLKCGGGDNGLYKDSRFEENYRKAKELGLPVGAYWFSKATDEDRAIKEALYCISLLKNKQFELPIYMDVELPAIFALGKNAVTDIAVAFCETLEAAGYYAGIYSSVSYFRQYFDMDRIKLYSLWKAAWGTTKPDDAGMWQFGGETNKLRSNKITGKTVDQDYLYVDYPEAIKSHGLNGYGNVSRETWATVINKVLEACDGYDVLEVLDRVREAVESGVVYNNGRV